MKKIIFYEKENGKIPVNDFIIFLNKQNKKLLAKFYSKLDYLKIDLLGGEDVKYIKDKIYELRIKNESNICRFFYFHYIGNKIIILNGFLKKDKKFKKNVLDKAIEYKNDYIKRIG